MAEEIRTLRPEEVDTFMNLASQAFRTPPSDARYWRSKVRVEELRGLFVDGEAQAVLRVIDMPLWMGAAPVADGGISAVASPPENRRRGYVQRLLHATLVEMREKRWPLSSLYPFYFPFYKRYGWEHIADDYTYKMPIEQLPQGKTEGRWQPVLRGTDQDAEQRSVSPENVQVLRDIYDAWCVGRTGPVARDDRWWQRKLREGRDKRPDVYYWSDTQGRPRAYLIYNFQTLATDWDRRLAVDELIALDTEALRAVLIFLRNHNSQAQEVSIALGEDARFLALLDDPRLKVEVEAGVMLRMVDVEQALAARRYPEGARGGLTMRVADSFLEWNNGTFTLEVDETGGRVSRSDAEPQLSLDQKTLTRLYSGYLTAAEAANFGMLQVHDPAALSIAGSIFAAPRPYMPDFF